MKKVVQLCGAGLDDNKLLDSDGDVTQKVSVVAEGDSRERSREIVLGCGSLMIRNLDEWSFGMTDIGCIPPWFYSFAFYRIFDVIREGGIGTQFILRSLARSVSLHGCSTIHLLATDEIDGTVIDDIRSAVDAHRSGHAAPRVCVHIRPFAAYYIDKVYVCCVDPRLGFLVDKCEDAASTRLIRWPGPEGTLNSCTEDSIAASSFVVSNIKSMLADASCEHATVSVVGHEDCSARRDRLGVDSLDAGMDRDIMQSDTDAANLFMQMNGFNRSGNVRNASGSFFLVRDPSGGFETSVK